MITGEGVQQTQVEHAPTMARQFAEQAPAQPQQGQPMFPPRVAERQSQQTAAYEVPKKKSKKLIYILAAVAVIIVVIIIASGGGGTDYVATIKTVQPFADEGIFLTYVTVLNKYISSPVWEERKSGDTGYVDISGTLKGTEMKILVTIRADPNPNDLESVVTYPVSVTLDGEKNTTQNEVAEALFAMFLAYEEGYDNFYDFFDDYFN
jgi:hypothetical protein